LTFRGQMIVCKCPQELGIMRESGRITARALDAVAAMIRPGVTTGELDRTAARAIEDAGAKPAFLGYLGYPATLCVSLNDEVVHGIPGRREIREGDIVSVDIGVQWKGFFGDMAATFAVGAIDDASRRLLDATRTALESGIEQCRVGNHLSDVSAAIQSVAEGAGFSVVREYVGHGIGRAMHEDPQIPNYGVPGKGPVLSPGMTLALEPMVNAGTWEVELQDDQWTVLTKDRLRSAHFEHTVAVTDDGPEVLTLV
jgi:methionyl aminopeptidase